MRPSASMEDYLEAIAKIAEEQGRVRVTLISKRLGVKKPSVTEALQALSADGLVKYARYGAVELTPEGRRIALDVVRRHEVLFRFLSEVLGLDAETADEDACRLEHSLSPAAYRRLAAFVDYLATHPEKRRHLLGELDRVGQGARPHRNASEVSGE
jgi:DtxR family Mn-dependent transcriptional regulator